jgi:hypothetical protein
MDNSRQPPLPEDDQGCAAQVAVLQRPMGMGIAYKLYFAPKKEIAALVTNFIFCAGVANCEIFAISRRSWLQTLFCDYN